jgi:hypothetical protein
VREVGTHLVYEVAALILRRACLPAFAARQILLKSPHVHALGHDRARDDGVLELHEVLTAPGPPLELHLVTDSETGAAAAWWEDDAGTWLWIADVGKA